MDKDSFSNQFHFDPLHCNRTYREQIKSADLISYQVQEKESDLLVETPVLLFEEALASLKHCRMILEQYIAKNPLFRTTLKPYPPDDKAHPWSKGWIRCRRLFK